VRPRVGELIIFRMPTYYLDKFWPILAKLLHYKIDITIAENKRIVTDMLTECYYCDCCARHQIDKPAIVQKCVERIPVLTGPHECDCDCRHIARRICAYCTNDDDNML
jgi:hypothetical protein